jgi:opacity protein-like surface antigen
VPLENLSGSFVPKSNLANDEPTDTMHDVVVDGAPAAAEDRTQDLHVRVKTTSLMANLVYDFETGSKFTPFTMVGLGYAHHSFNDGMFSEAGDNDTSSSYDNAFAIQAGAGFAYKVTDYISLSTQYRFFRTSGANVSACLSSDPDCASGRVNQKIDFNHHAVLVGVTFAIN